MEELSLNYFRNLWQTNVNDLENHCESWENVCKDNIVPDEVLGEIRTTVGLARLLMRQKLHQFKGLIDDSEFKTGEKEITCLDLQGFWDMVYYEVEKIQKSFENLLKCKNNEWKFVEDTTAKQIKKKVPIQNITNKKVDTAKSHSLAARQRLAEAKKKMLAQREQQKDQALVEIIQSSTEKANPINGRIVNVSSDIMQLKKTNGEVRHSPRIHKKVNTTTTDVAVCTKENLSLNVTPKFREVQEKSQITSLQNKENFVPETDSSSKTQTKSIEIPHKKSRGKSKEFGKLQCVTRSAKKALMAQKNV